MTFTGTTPEVILREAGRLFSIKGFHGTSTREIAEAVGIRQPSLFHHFPTKTDIAKALLEYDRERSPGLRGEDHLPGATPPVRLYHSLRREFEIELTSEYDLRGLYLSSLLDEPEFTTWRDAYDAALAETADMIRAGIESGDFVDQDPRLVVEIIDAVLNQTIRWHPEKRDPATPSEITEIIMRLVLKRPGRIPAIRRAVDRAMAAKGQA